MKKFIIVNISFFLFCLLIVQASETPFEYFKGSVNGDAVVLEWRSTQEATIARYEVQRLGNGSFETIATKDALGKSSVYKHVDNDSFTKPTDDLQGSVTNTYRIKVVYKTESELPTYSDQVTLTRNISSIKRTLGMLKEMFR